MVGVNYPGLVTHPQHRVATEQMGGRCYGGMLSFLVKMSEDPSLPPEHTALQVSTISKQISVPEVLNLY